MWYWISICHHENCLQDLLPPQYDPSLSARLRHYAFYHVTHVRTKRYCSFINYALTNYLMFCRRLLYAYTAKILSISCCFYVSQLYVIVFIYIMLWNYSNLMAAKYQQNVFTQLLTSILHCESKKTRHYNIVHNFAKCWPIFKFFSLTDSLVNMQQNRH